MDDGKSLQFFSGHYLTYYSKLLKNSLDFLHTVKPRFSAISK